MLAYYPARSSPFGELWLAGGVTGAAAYVQTAHHVMARDSLPTAERFGGHRELGAAALLKAVWCDLHLASLLTHLFCVIVYSHMCAFVVLDLVPSVLYQEIG